MQGVLVLWVYSLVLIIERQRKEKKLGGGGETEKEEALGVMVVIGSVF